ncbi:hypothetical protein LEP1GSC161_1114 [Leptospira santarosai str. CBC1416]|uniref:Uncharacterized protein n=1 Tax=Leptospira santarosai str. CBC1416 TaxID=1193059 RepID=M6VY85_9LEPT|nr:hypothetical protein [Leptospira santarosai]EMM87523.1 hypothetical protein LEP1GSC039_2387 [Leptospira santarosai str. 2000027870]EMO60111.1 hypothetical protein LEP1GSC161_1114 [Leptospira santarosai str. CBC1416]MDI7155489.1 hypothetical protein [Leptospira santarosai]
MFLSDILIIHPKTANISLFNRCETLLQRVKLFGDKRKTDLPLQASYQESVPKPLEHLYKIQIHFSLYDSLSMAILCGNSIPTTIISEL